MAITNDQIEASLKLLEKSLSEKVPFVSGIGAPAALPYFAGQMYYDTAASEVEIKWYFSHVDGVSFAWLPLTEGSSSGTPTIATWYSLTGFISNANDTAPVFVEGDVYLLNSNTVSPSASWGSLPAGIGDGDIIKLVGGIWQLEVDISIETSGTVIAEFDDLWAVILGDNGWLNIPQYNPALADNLVSQVDVGGIKAGTQVSSLRYKTWESIINEMVFPNTLPVYTLPTLTTSQDLFKERGKDLTGIVSFNFIKNDGGNATSSVLDFVAFNNSIIWSKAIPTVGGSFVQNIDLDDPAYDVVTDPDAGEHVTVKYTVNYGQGVVKNDSHGAPDTRPPSVIGDGPVQADAIVESIRYGSLYPFWVVASNDPALDPGVPGDSTAAPVLDENWVKANMDKALYNEDGLNTIDAIINVATGSEYLIAVCPPGTNVTQAIDKQYGFEYTAMITQAAILDINDALGLNPVIYNVHYFRNVSVDGWAENQEITVTIE